MGDFEDALEVAKAWIEEIEGVQMVAETEADGERAVLVYVHLPETAARIPRELRGYRVIVELGDPIHIHTGTGERP